MNLAELTYVPTEHVWDEYHEWRNFFQWYLPDNTYFSDEAQKAVFLHKSPVPDEYVVTDIADIVPEEDIWDELSYENIRDELFRSDKAIFYLPILTF